MSLYYSHCTTSYILEVFPISCLKLKRELFVGSRTNHSEKPSIHRPWCSQSTHPARGADCWRLPECLPDDTSPIQVLRQAQRRHFCSLSNIQTRHTLGCKGQGSLACRDHEMELRMLRQHGRQQQPLLGFRSANSSL